MGRGWSITEKGETRGQQVTGGRASVQYGHNEHEMLMRRQAGVSHMSQDGLEDKLRLKLNSEERQVSKLTHQDTFGSSTFIKIIVGFVGILKCARNSHMKMIVCRFYKWLDFM